MQRTGCATNKRRFLPAAGINDGHDNRAAYDLKSKKQATTLSGSEATGPKLKFERQKSRNKHLTDTFAALCLHLFSRCEPHLFGCKAS
jgi:hypothetical protein